MPNTYLFYIDESGQREYGQKTSRYFTLCGLGVPVASWQQFNNDIYAIKQTYFGKPTVEIKSSWLRFPRSRQKHYIDEFGITEDQLNEFSVRLYSDLLNRPEIVLFAAVVDKTQMSTVYATPQSPSSLAYRLLFERLQRFLQNQDEACYGLVVFDKITDASAAATGYENLLSIQHMRYLRQGTDYVPIENIVEGLLFIPSHENNFIQLADLCAYNVFRQFREHGDVWDKPTTPRWPLYLYFGQIVHQFYCDDDGTVSGWGIKKFPGPRQLGLPNVQWVIRGDPILGYDVYQK